MNAPMVIPKRTALFEWNSEIVTWLRCIIQSSLSRKCLHITNHMPPHKSLRQTAKNFPMTLRISQIYTHCHKCPQSNTEIITEIIAGSCCSWQNIPESQIGSENQCACLYIYSLTACAALYSIANHEWHSHFHVLVSYICWQVCTKNHWMMTDHPSSQKSLRKSCTGLILHSCNQYHWKVLAKYQIWITISSELVKQVQRHCIKKLYWILTTL